MPFVMTTHQHKRHGCDGFVSSMNRIIEIERLQREATRSRLKAMESEARYKQQSAHINTVVEMMKVWSACNLAVMWGYRDLDQDDLNE